MKRAWKKWLSLVFAVLLIAPTVLLMRPAKSDAIIGCLGGYLFNSLIGGVQAIGSAISSIAVSEKTVASNTSKTSGNTQGSLLKECILDITAKQIARSVLQSFTKSVVNWINSGFEGKPSFLTNPQGFLLDVADKEFGREIAKIAPMLCSPFRLNLQFALGLQYSVSSRDEVRCRLSDVIANARGSYDSFVTGDFRSGGWRSWVSVAGAPQNNIYGAYVNTVTKLDASIVGANGEEIKLLDFGQGFKSWRKCEEREPDEKDKNGNVLRTGKCTQEGKLQTPGSIIVGSTNNTLKSSLDELAVADEIDEIFGALVNQLLIRTLGPGGLLGNSDPETGGGPSYLDQLVNSPEAAEKLASIRPPEGINCQFEYEASGNIADPDRVMLVSYRRTNAKVVSIQGDTPATLTSPRRQLVIMELIEGPALGTRVTAENVVRAPTDVLVVGPTAISFDRFEGEYAGVQTMRLTPQPANKPDGTPLKRTPGVEWSDYFLEVKRGCRNQINQYAERNNDAAVGKAGAPTTAGPGAPIVTPPREPQVERGNIARNRKAEQSLTYSYYVPENGADDSPASQSIAMTNSYNPLPWWQVDLSTDRQGEKYTNIEIEKVVIFRDRVNNSARSENLRLFISATPFPPANALDSSNHYASIKAAGVKEYVVPNSTAQTIGGVRIDGQPGDSVEFPIDAADKSKPYIRIYQMNATDDRGHSSYLALADVKVMGKATRVDTTGSGTPLPPAVLSVLFDRPSDSLATIPAGSQVFIDPSRPIQLTTNKDVSNVSLRVKLLAKTPPGASNTSMHAPFLPRQWAQYFNSFTISYAASNKRATTHSFVVPGDFSTNVINPIVCGSDATRALKGECDTLGTIQVQKTGDQGSWITFAEGLTMNAAQPIVIGFTGTLRNSGFADHTARILVEAQYIDGTAPRTAQFYLDFIIN